MLFRVLRLEFSDNGKHGQQAASFSGLSEAELFYASVTLFSQANRSQLGDTVRSLLGSTFQKVRKGLQIQLELPRASAIK